MTREQLMTAQTLKHIAKKDFKRKVRLNRQAEFQKVKDRDCYGVQKKEA